MRTICIAFFFLFIGSVNAQMPFQVIEQTDSSMTIRFLLPAYQVTTTNNGFQSIETTNEAFTEEKGSPRLPFFYRTIEIPSKKQPTITILKVDSTILSNINIEPSMGYLKNNVQHLNESFDTQKTVYNYYPNAFFRLETPYNRQNHIETVLKIVPFRFNSANKTAIVYKSIDILINYTSKFITSATTHLKSMNQNIFNGSMLVLCPQKYTQAIRPLVSWKNKKGIDTKIIVSDTIATIDKMQTIINDYYNLHHNTYLLLVGDSSDIPQKDIKWPSDNAWGYILGDDSYPEVVVGRIAGKTSNDIDNQVKKIIHFEQTTQLSNLASPNLLVASDQAPGDNGEYDYEHLHKINDSLIAYGFNHGDEMYDGSHGGNDADGNPTISMVQTSINNGKTIFLYTGHSGTNTLITSGFSSNDASGLTNTTAHPWSIIAGCKIGQLSKDTCLAESLMWAHHNDSATGMVCMLASTTDQWWNPPMNAQDYFITTLLQNENADTIPSFGLQALKSFNHINTIFNEIGFETTDTWSIFGDPSLQLFTKPSTQTSLSFNKQIHIGQDTLTLFSPNENAHITLSTKDSIVYNGIIMNGKLTAHIDPIANTDTLWVVATGFNMLPTIDTIVVIPAQTDIPFITQFTVHDTGISQNNSIENGDSVDVTISVKNIGISTSQPYSITLTSADTSIIIYQSEQNTKALLPEETQTLTNSFGFFIKESTPDYSVIPLSFTITNSKGQQFTFNKSFHVQSPTIIHISEIIQPTSASNSNSKAEPGEIIKYGIILKNTGHALATFSSNNLKTNNTNCSIISQKTNHQTIKPSESDTVYFEVAFSPNCQNGEFIPLTYTGTYNNKKIETDILLKVGTITENWNDGTLNHYEWNNASQKPWFISNKEYYNDSYSLQSGAIGDNQSTTFGLTANILFDDTLSFMIKTSCESPHWNIDHYTYYDYLNFSIDGISKYKQAGITTDWILVSMPVSKGNHNFTWEYIKDDMSYEGADAVWIDSITLPYFQTTPQSQFYFTTTALTETEIGKQYTYLISTNKASEAAVKIYQKPSWLNYDANKLSGTSNNTGVDTIVITAQWNEYFINQIIILETKPTSFTELVNNNFVISPNPAHKTLSIQSEQSLLSFEIFNIQTKLIMQGNSQTIDISTLTPGIYTIHVITNKNSTRKLFIKQ